MRSSSICATLFTGRLLTSLHKRRFQGSTSTPAHSLFPVHPAFHYSTRLPVQNFYLCLLNAQQKPTRRHMLSGAQSATDSPGKHVVSRLHGHLARCFRYGPIRTDTRDSRSSLIYGAPPSFFPRTTMRWQPREVKYMMGSCESDGVISAPGRSLRKSSTPVPSFASSLSSPPSSHESQKKKIMLLLLL